MPGFYVIEHGCLGVCKNKCARAASRWVEYRHGLFPTVRVFLRGKKKDWSITNRSASFQFCNLRTLELGDLWDQLVWPSHFQETVGRKAVHDQRSIKLVVDPWLQLLSVEFFQISLHLYQGSSTLCFHEIQSGSVLNFEVIRSLILSPRLWPNGSRS